MPRIRIKRGTTTQWIESTTPLLSGELGYDLTTKVTKIGDGTTLWASLPSIDSSSSGADTGEITFEGSAIIGNGTMSLVPNANLLTNEYSQTQYLIIDPTAPNHIHIRAGGNIDESTAELILGGERNKVVVSDSSKSVGITTAATITNIYANAHEANNEDLIVPETSDILIGDNIVIAGTGHPVTYFSPDPNNTGFSIVRATGVTFIAGESYTFVREEPYENYWSFGSDGVLSGPAMGGVKVPGIINAGVGSDLFIASNDANIQMLATNHVRLDASNGNIYLNPSGGIYLGTSEFAPNEIATIGDVAAANEYTDNAVAGLGNSIDGQYVPVGDVGNIDGVAPLDENALIPDSYIPSNIARDSELFSGSYNDLSDKPNIALGAVQWTANHYLLPGGENTRYLAGDIVYDGGNIYVANFDNESLPTTNTQYWSLVGSGKRLNIDGRDVPNITYDQLNGKPTIPDLTGYATETYVGTAISNLIDGAGPALDTLNELAAAINDDASFASTVTTALGNKLDSSTASSTYLTQTDASTTYAPINSPTFTGTVVGITKSMIDLANVDNTADVNKPISTATQTELDLKAPLANPAFTGTVTGITKSMVDLANVDNTSDANKPVSTATQTSLDGKVDKIASMSSKSSSYTLQTTDIGTLIEMSAGGTLTITDSSSFPVGFTVDVLQTGSSQVTIAGTSFTPNATPGLKLRTQWSSATLIKRGLNSWVVLGDLSA